MNKMSRDAAIRKLKGLRAKIDSLNQELGSEKEVHAFTEAMHRLIAQHQVDMAELAPTMDEVDPFDKIAPDYIGRKFKVRKKSVPWLHHLGQFVAQGNYCRLLGSLNSSSVRFAGRRANAQAAADAYLTLAIAAEEIADREYVDFFHKVKKEGRVQAARGFRQSFLSGFVRRIGGKYFDYTEATRAYFASSQKALVAIKNSRDEVNRWVDSTVSGIMETPELEVSNLKGYSTGIKKAEEVEMSPHRKVN